MLIGNAHFRLGLRDIFIFIISWCNNKILTKKEALEFVQLFFAWHLTSKHVLRQAYFGTFSRVYEKCRDGEQRESERRKRWSLRDTMKTEVVDVYIAATQGEEGGNEANQTDRCRDECHHGGFRGPDRTKERIKIENEGSGWGGWKKKIRLKKGKKNENAFQGWIWKRTATPGWSFPETEVCLCLLRVILTLGLSCFCLDDVGSRVQHHWMTAWWKHNISHWNIWFG